MRREVEQTVYVLYVGGTKTQKEEIKFKSYRRIHKE